MSPQPIPVNLNVILQGIPGVAWNSRIQTATFIDVEAEEAVVRVLMSHGFVPQGEGKFRRYHQEVTVVPE